MKRDRGRRVPKMAKILKNFKLIPLKFKILNCGNQAKGGLEIVQNSKKQHELISK